MGSSDSNECKRGEEQMSQNTTSNSNSASVTVTGPNGVTGPNRAGMTDKLLETGLFKMQQINLY